MRKGFTLIELLIVIGIISILATAVVLVLNPAQLLAQARDSTRISDMGSIKSAIGLYLATATSPAVTAEARSTASSTCAFTTCVVPLAAALQDTDGTGWVAINLSNTTGGSALSVLPLDPTNTATYQYAYKGDATDLTFELDATLESIKYSGMKDTDGGNSPVYYEVGTEPGLDL